MYPRNITPELLEALEDSPVLFLRGARQVGKSTLAKELLADRFPAKYVSLDNATALAAATSDPTGFIAGQPRPLIIDEVQRVPELLLAIKEDVDNNRRPGQFLLTGSANLLTLPMVNESLAGRMEIQTLWPLSHAEQVGRKTDFVHALFSGSIADFKSDEPYDLPSMLTVGGYPESVSKKSAKRRAGWFDAYLTSIVERDIRDIARIQETTTMLRLLRLLATRTANQLNQSELSRTIQVPNASLGRYMNLLEKVFLIHFLPAWSANLGKRLVKAPKLYMVDCGLAAHLMEVDADRLTSSPEIAGQLLETFVVNEVLKHLTWSRVMATPYHFRTHAGLEVDLVLERPSGQLACIEIKHSAQVAAKHFRGLKSLRDDLNNRFQIGVVLYTGTEVVPFGDRLYAVPLAALWR